MKDTLGALFFKSCVYKFNQPADSKHIVYWLEAYSLSNGAVSLFTYSNDLFMYIYVHKEIVIFK